MRLILFLLLTVNFLVAQTEDAWVYFNGKPNSATFLANPLSMLTQRSLDRRVAQNIPLDIKDVPVEASFITQITNSPGIVVMAKSRWLNALHIRGTQANIIALTSLNFVTKVVFANKSLNVSNKINSTNNKKLTVNNKWANVQTTYNYGNSSNQVQMLNGHLLHQQNFTGQGKIIAVLDSGFTGVNTVAPFQNLVNNNQILGGYNFPDRNTNYYSRHNHGTNVLSTMGGFSDNALVGTAPNAQYYLFITEDVNSENPVEESYWVEGAELADYYGADVINSSLGYSDYDNPAYSHTYQDINGNKTFSSQGANIAFSKGIVVVVSAGNSGNSSNPYISSPADAFGALAIGAVDSNENYASFSSVGPSFDGRIKPDVCAKGAGTTVSTTTGVISTSNGTSFSGPLIAGMVATLWSANPSFTAQEIVNRIKQSADNYLAPTDKKGYGVPDFQLALTLTLNTEEFQNNSSMVYPNPAENFVQVNVNSASEINIYNNLGQLVLTKSLFNYQNSLDISGFSNGIYYYEIINEKLTKGKIIKQ